MFVYVSIVDDLPLDIFHHFTVQNILHVGLYERLFLLLCVISQFRTTLQLNNYPKQRCNKLFDVESLFPSTNSSFFHISQSLWDIFQTVATYPFLCEFWVQLCAFGYIYIENAVTQNKPCIRNQLASEWVKKIFKRSRVELHYTDYII